MAPWSRHSSAKGRAASTSSTDTDTLVAYWMNAAVSGGRGLPGGAPCSRNSASSLSCSRLSPGLMRNRPWSLPGGRAILAC
ncbi:hypothetical protein ACFFX0_30775 [Citricoccus parietis]|uniref:Uncharacterized protein n=1 Tax=Citricoccus parietis TaxID=592307 RepID=A0ABV5G894_9MICC